MNRTFATKHEESVQIRYLQLPISVAIEYCSLVRNHTGVIIGRTWACKYGGLRGRW